jgi:hypothetical protein
MMRRSGYTVILSMLRRRLIGARAGLSAFHFVVKARASSSIPSPINEIKFQERGRAQEQSASHVTSILQCPALRYPNSGEVSNFIPSPVKRIQDLQSKQVAGSDDDEDEWEVIAEYATNHLQQ